GSTTVTYIRDATDRIVSRTHTGTAQVKYGSTGGAMSMTMNASGSITEYVAGLPGGVVFTAIPSGAYSWAYPNIHGDIMATTNSVGGQSGGTWIYTPFGEPVTGDPVTPSTSQTSYVWVGS